MNRSLLALTLLCAVGPLCRAEPTYVQKVVPTPPSTLTTEQQEHALVALLQAQPDLAAFLQQFPNATHRIWQAKPNAPVTHVDFSAKLRDAYLVHLWYDSRFNPEYTIAADSRIRHFGVSDVSRIRQLKPGEVLRPIHFTPDELAAFCADPDAAIAAKIPKK